MSNALSIVALAESIGATSPVSNEEGALVHSPETAPSFNKSLRKPTVAIDEDFVKKHAEKALAGKSIVELADKIGSQGLGSVENYNPDLDSSVASRNKARRALQEAIQILSEGDLDYWCPDAATRESAPKIKNILEKFVSRL